MSTTEIAKRITEGSQHHMTRFVALYYLFTILMGTFVLFFHSRLALVTDVAGVFYLASTAVLYALSKAANTKQGR